MYIIVELDVEEQEQDRISNLSQKPTMKLESANKHTTSEIATADIPVKQEVDCEIPQRKTDIVDGSHSGHTTESMKIKSEQVEVYNVDFINSNKANNNVSKHLIPETIGSGSSKLRLLDDWWIWAGRKNRLHHRFAKDFEGEERWRMLMVFVI